MKYNIIQIRRSRQCFGCVQETCDETHPRESGMIVKIKRLFVDDTITNLTVSSESNTRQKEEVSKVRHKQIPHHVISRNDASTTEMVHTS